MDRKAEESPKGPVHDLTAQGWGSVPLGSKVNGGVWAWILRSAERYLPEAVLSPRLHLGRGRPSERRYLPRPFCPEVLSFVVEGLWPRSCLASSLEWVCTRGVLIWGFIGQCTGTEMEWTLWAGDWPHSCGHLIIGLPPPCPWRTGKVVLFPNWYKVQPRAQLPFPSHCIYVSWLLWVRGGN
jgi:hypothetical protein